MADVDSSYEYLNNDSAVPLDLQHWFQCSTLDAYPSSTRAHLTSRAPDLPSGGSFGSKLVALVVPSLSASFPPTSTHSPAFRALLAGIATARKGALATQADALAYYLLLDLASALNTAEAVELWNEMTQDEREEVQGRPEVFARSRKLPRAFREAVKGYWFVDRGMLKSALPYLAHADFQPDLQRALSPLSPLSPPPHERAPLLLSLQRQTRLTTSLPSAHATSEEKEAALYALKSTLVAKAHVYGLSAAWREAGAVGEGTAAVGNYARETERECKVMLLKFCFEPTPQRKAIDALLALDLSPSDAHLLESFALSRTAPSSALDILLVRLINAGDYLSAVRLHDQAPVQEWQHKEGAANVGMVKALRESRRRIIEGARAVVPEVQRALLDVGREMEGAKQEGVDAAAAADGVEAGDLTMSWENVAGQPSSAVQTPSKSTTSSTLIPLSASPALRQPPSAKSSPRSASHATDPLAALLSAVVRASPSRAATQGNDGSPTSSPAAPPPTAGANEPEARTAQPLIGFLQRKRESFGVAGAGAAGRASYNNNNNSNSTPTSPATPRSGPATPHLQTAHSSLLSTPTRAPANAVQKTPLSPATTLLASSGLTSRSPFAALPRLPGPTVPSSASQTQTTTQSSSGRFTSASGGWNASGEGRKRGSGTTLRLHGQGSPFGAGAGVRRGEEREREEEEEGRKDTIPWGGVEVVVPAALPRASRSRSQVHVQQDEDVEMSGAEERQPRQEQQQQQQEQGEREMEEEEEEVPRRRGARKGREVKAPVSKVGRRAVAQLSSGGGGESGARVRQHRSQQGTGTNMDADADVDGDITIPGQWEPLDQRSRSRSRSRTISPPPRRSPAVEKEAAPSSRAPPPRKAAVQARARITRSQSTTADLQDLHSSSNVKEHGAGDVPISSTPLTKTRSSRNNTATAAGAGGGGGGGGGGRKRGPTRSQSLHSDMSSVASASEAEEEDQHAPTTGGGGGGGKRTRSTAAAAAGGVRRSARISVEPEEETPGQGQARKRGGRRVAVPAALREE